jgi:hypothetical protein
MAKARKKKSAYGATKRKPVRKPKKTPKKGGKKPRKTAPKKKVPTHQGPPPNPMDEPTPNG